MAPAQGVARSGRRGVRQHREDESLRVPKRVAVVPGAGQALGRDCAPLGTSPGLKGMEEGETHGLLELGVAVQLHVRSIPEIVEIGTLGLDQPIPASVPRRGQGGDHLVADRCQRALARPPVGQKLDHSQPLPVRQARGHGHSANLLPALRSRLGPFWTVDDMVHARGHPQQAAVRRVDEHHPFVVVIGVLRLQRRLEDRRGTRVPDNSRAWFVRDQLRLHDHAQIAVERLDLVQDRRGCALDERDESGRADANRRPRR